MSTARELLHPHSLAEALGYAARLDQFSRDGKAMRERAEAATGRGQVDTVDLQDARALLEGLT